MDTVEAVKAVIYPHGQVDVNGKPGYKYLIGLIVLSDQPFPSQLVAETVSMGNCSGQLFEALSLLKHYQPPHHLGELSGALIGISTMEPSQLEPIK